MQFVTSCRRCPSCPRSRSPRGASARPSRGAAIESTLAPGINALKTFDPPLHALDGTAIEGVRRIGKHLVVDVAGDLHVLVHLMSAGRLQLYDKRAALRDRTSRLLLRLDRRPRAAPARVRHQAGGVGEGAARRRTSRPTRRSRRSGPRRGPTRRRTCARCSPPAARARCTRVLRDQRVIAGIGRSWVDEILWTARLSPFKRGDDLADEEAAALRDGDRRGPRRRARALRARSSQLPIPDKLPLPLQVHRHQGEPCPRCGTTIEAVHYEDYVMCYCPQEQTGGKVLKDRRLSRLLK